MKLGQYYGSSQFGQAMGNGVEWCVKGIHVDGTIECLEPEPESEGTREAVPATPGAGPPETPGIKVKIDFDWNVKCFCENTPINPDSGLPDHPLGPGLRGSASVGKCGGYGSDGNKNVRSFSWDEEQYIFECRDPNTPPGSIDDDPQAGMRGCDCYSWKRPEDAIDRGVRVRGKCYGTYEETQTIAPFRVGDMYSDGSQEGFVGTAGDPATIAALRACEAKKTTPSWANPPFDMYNIQNLEVADCMNKLICCPNSHGDFSKYLAQAWIKEIFNTTMGYKTFNTVKCMDQPKGSTSI
jgi:hypothetical protein